MSDNIMEKQEQEIDIQSRNTSAIGKPKLLRGSSFGKLSGTQRRIMEALELNDVCLFNKSADNISIDMKDLSALTAVNGA